MLNWWQKKNVKNMGQQSASQHTRIYWGKFFCLYHYERSTELRFSEKASFVEQRACYGHYIYAMLAPWCHDTRSPIATGACFQGKNTTSRAAARVEARCRIEGTRARTAAWARGSQEGTGPRRGGTPLLLWEYRPPYRGTPALPVPPVASLRSGRPGPARLSPIAAAPGPFPRPSEPGPRGAEGPRPTAARAPLGTPRWTLPRRRSSAERRPSEGREACGAAEDGRREALPRSRLPERGDPRRRLSPWTGRERPAEPRRPAAGRLPPRPPSPPPPPPCPVAGRGRLLPASPRRRVPGRRRQVSGCPRRARGPAPPAASAGDRLGTHLPRDRGPRAALSPRRQREGSGGRLPALPSPAALGCEIGGSEGDSRPKLAAASAGPGRCRRIPGAPAASAPPPPAPRPPPAPAPPRAPPPPPAGRGRAAGWGRTRGAAGGELRAAGPEWWSGTGRLPRGTGPPAGRCRRSFCRGARTAAPPSPTGCRGSVKLSGGLVPSGQSHPVPTLLASRRGTFPCLCTHYTRQIHCQILSCPDRSRGWPRGMCGITVS